MTSLPWPGFEPGLSRPQREVLTTIRSRLTWLVDVVQLSKVNELLRLRVQKTGSSYRILHFQAIMVFGIFRLIQWRIYIVKFWTCAPPGIRILSISCSFWENLAKSYVGTPPRVGAPSSGKSWIRHCNWLVSTEETICDAKHWLSIGDLGFFYIRLKAKIVFSLIFVAH